VGNPVRKRTSALAISALFVFSSAGSADVTDGVSLHSVPGRYGTSTGMISQSRPALLIMTAGVVVGGVTLPPDR